MMKTSDLLVRALEMEGIRWVFAVPGEENLDLLDSIRRSDTVELVVVRHEQGAGFMAATVGRLTGTPGVALATLGPGATNLVTSVAYAQLGGFPTVFLTGQKPIRHSKQGAFQILDVVGMMEPLTHFTHQVVSGAYLPARVREAFRLAAGTPAGATHLELPEDVLREESDARPLPAPRSPRPRAAPEALDEAAELLARARRPLVVLGAGAQGPGPRGDEACSRLGTLVESLGIPFVTTQMGKGVIPEGHSRWVGTAALSEGDFVHRAIEAADVILNVGHRVVEKPPYRMNGDALEEGAPPGPRVIHMDERPAQVDPVYHPHLEVVGDLAEATGALVERLASHPRKGGWDFRHLPALQEAAESHFLARARSDAFPMRPERVVRDVRACLPERSHLTLDNGMYKLWFTRNYRSGWRHGLLVDNALATMGAGLPSAMAAKMVNPELPVVTVVGDGGLLMNGQEMETAVRLGLDLVIVLLRDDAYGMIRWKQEDMGLPDFGLTFGNPDFVAWARAYGAQGHRVESAAGLAPALTSALEAGGVQLLDVPVSYVDDRHTLQVEIPRLARSIPIPSPEPPPE